MPYGSSRIGMVSPTNECARAAYGLIRSRMFFHSQCTDKHERLYGFFGCVVEDLLGHCIPAKRREILNKMKNY